MKTAARVLLFLFLGFIALLFMTALASCSVEHHLQQSEKHINKAKAKGFKPTREVDTTYITKIDSVWNETTKEFTKFVTITDTLYKERVEYKYMTRQERKYLRDSTAFALKTLKENNAFALKMKAKENKALKTELAKERQKSKQIDDVEDTKQAEARNVWLSLLFGLLALIVLLFIISKIKKYV